MRDEWSGPTTIQVVIVVVLALVALVTIVLGARSAWRSLSRRRTGEHISGFGLGVTLAGLAVGLLAADIGVRVFTGAQERNIFGLWFFLPAPQLGDWVYGLLATPALDLLIIAVFLAFLGVPSLTQLRDYRASLADPKTRSAALWTTSIVVAAVVGGFGGSIGAGIVFGRGGALPGAFVGGLAAMAIVIVIGTVITNLHAKRKGTTTHD
jgi:hypothetical protein